MLPSFLNFIFDTQFLAKHLTASGPSAINNSNQTLLILWIFAKRFETPYGMSISPDLHRNYLCFKPNIISLSRFNNDLNSCARLRCLHTNTRQAMYLGSHTEFCTIFFFFVSPENKAWEVWYLYFLLQHGLKFRTWNTTVWWSWMSVTGKAWSVALVLSQWDYSDPGVIPGTYEELRCVFFFTSIVSYLLFLSLVLLLLNFLLNSWVFKSQSLSVLSLNVLHFFLALRCLKIHI